MENKLQKKRHTQCVTPEVQGILLDQEAKRAIECLVDKISATLVAHSGHIDTESLGVDVDQQILSKETMDAAINWDYQPMQSLDEYLTPCSNGFPLSELSLSQYDLLVRTLGTDDDDLYLDYFNKSYYIFSQLLRRKYTYTQLRDFVASQSFATDVQAYWTWQYVSQLIDLLVPSLEIQQLYRVILCQEVDRLAPLVIKPDPVAQSTFDSPIYINKKALNERELTRIINAMIEMQCFQSANGAKIPKNQLYGAFAAFLHRPEIIDYNHILQDDKNLSTKGNTATAVFVRLGQAHEHWINNCIDKTSKQK